MTTITIPASIEDATAALNGLGSLLTAKEWERAAIVATYVDLADREGRPSKETATSSSFHSPSSFAALGINGFKSKDTVRRYVEEWLRQRPRPLPGDAIDLDGLPTWPTRYGEGKEKHGAKRSPGQVAAALADPEFAENVAGRMSPDAVAALAAALIAHSDSEDHDAPRLPRYPKPRDYGHLIEGAVNNLSVALAAAGAGRYTLTSRDEALLYFVTMLLGERLAPEKGDLAEMVESKLNANLDEIERYANAGGAR